MPKKGIEKPIDKKRVFIGIGLPDEIASECERLQAGFGDLPLRLIQREDLHLTLVPPWEMESGDQWEVENKIREALVSVQPFMLDFEKPGYGPQVKKPRLVWILCKLTKELEELEHALTRTFGHTNRRPFLPHVTIARFKQGQYLKNRLRSFNWPKNLSMRVETVQLFESVRNGKSRYQKLDSFPLRRPA